VVDIDSAKDEEQWEEYYDEYMNDTSDYNPKDLYDF
jgi:hypothetical protein